MRRPRRAKLLGPLTLVKGLSDKLWYTLVLLPQSSDKVMVRCDIYGKDDHRTPPAAIENWKWMVEQEVAALSKPDTAGSSSGPCFSYQCGGKKDLYPT
jgi:hypothetical protein